MSLRVISGQAKGRRLKSVPGLETRPTADRVRQTMFDILGDLSGIRVLDLFAGTGALGIESLSRGAAHATFVESDKTAVSIVKENLIACGLHDRSSVRRIDAEAFLARRAPASTRYDLVFLDPPYDRGLAFIARLMGVLAARDRVSGGGRIVAESAAGDVDLPDGFQLLRTRIFGRTQIMITVREGSPEAAAPDENV